MSSDMSERKSRWKKTIASGIVFMIVVAVTSLASIFANDNMWLGAMINFSIGAWLITEEK
jgi:uncharacterized membrane-anchored protein